MWEFVFKELLQNEKALYQKNPVVESNVCPTTRDKWCKSIDQLERGNALMDLLIIAVAKKQVSRLLAVVKQVNLLNRMQLQIPDWKIYININ